MGSGIKRPEVFALQRESERRSGWFCLSVFEAAIKRASLPGSLRRASYTHKYVARELVSVGESARKCGWNNNYAKNDLFAECPKERAVREWRRLIKKKRKPVGMAHSIVRLQIRARCTLMRFCPHVGRYKRRGDTRLQLSFFQKAENIKYQNLHASPCFPADSPLALTFPILSTGSLAGHPSI